MEGIELILALAQNYLARLYDKCIQQNTDTEEIRKHLLSRGVLKNPAK